MSEKKYCSVSVPSIPFYFSHDPKWMKANGMNPNSVTYLSKPWRQPPPRKAPEQKPEPESKPETKPDSEPDPK